jgi:hypothetical protein
VLSVASAALEVDATRRAEVATRALTACRDTNAQDEYPVLALLEPLIGMITGDADVPTSARRPIPIHGCVLYRC